MKRYLSPWSVLLVVTIASDILAVTAMADSVGDCLKAKNSAGSKCGNPQDCCSSSCFAENFTCPKSACNPSPCPNAVCTNIRKYGECVKGAGPCYYCGTYNCATYNAYQSKDAAGQCQTLRCSGVQGYEDVCIP